VRIDGETLFVTDFMNLKIKSAQSFRGDHNGRIYVHVFIVISAYTYMNTYIYTVLKKTTTIYCLPEHFLVGSLDALR
jgi:hypothetical protein